VLLFVSNRKSVFLCVCVFGEIVNTKEFAADFGQIKEEEKKTKKKKAHATTLDMRKLRKRRRRYAHLLSV